MTAVKRCRRLDAAQPLPLGPEDYGFDYGFWLKKGHGFAFIENRRIDKQTTQRDYADAWPDRPAWPGHARWQTAPFGPDESITEPERSLVAAFDPTPAYKPIELYDLNRDRADEKNLLGDDQHVSTTDELMTYLTTTLSRDTIDRVPRVRSTDEQG